MFMDGESWGSEYFIRIGEVAQQLFKATFRLTIEKVVDNTL
jgi:hypothetical protein